MAEMVGEQFGNYRLVALLGRGGFAEVYQAQHIRLNRYVAIKLLHAHLTKDDTDNFLREAQIIADLNHPNIVRVFDFDVKEDRPFLVMDYSPNGTLRTRHRRGEHIPVPTVVSYVRQVADALQYAHDRKLIHRDVKPENMLIGKQDEILLADFGIAAIAHSTSSMSAQTPLGTIPYMAPEQIQAHARPASDQYALAVVAYEWLCGNLPFRGSSSEVLSKHLATPPPPLRAQQPSLSPAIERIILKALAKEPKQRFATVRDFAVALEAASQEQTATQSSSSTAGPSASATTWHPPRVVLPPTVKATPASTTEQSKGPKIAPTARDKGLNDPFNHPFHAPVNNGLPHGELVKDQSRPPGITEHRPRFSPLRRKLLIGAATAGVVVIGGSIAWHTLVPYSSIPFFSNPDLVYVYHGHSQAISSLAWSPDGRRIASAAREGDSTVQVWDATTGRHAYTFEGHIVEGVFGPLYNVYSVSWSPDGKRIVSTSDDGLLFVWNAADGGHEQQLNALGLNIFAAVWSPNGKEIAWTWNYDQVQVGDANDPNGNNYALGNANDTGDEIQALAWSPDSRYIAFACYRNIVQVWDTLSRQSFTYRGHTDIVHTVAWSPDGKYIASGSKDKAARVWDARSGKPVVVYEGHADEVQSVSWSPDSKRIVSASSDGTAQVWDAISGKNVYTYQGHNSPVLKGVTAIAWSHNGQYIASGGTDHTVQVWKAP